jgi:translocation and assembly module TamB
MAGKIIKILLSVIGSLVLLVAIMIFLAASGSFNKVIAGFIETQVSKNLNGMLVIGSIEGQPVSDFSVKDISILLDTDTLVHLGEIKIDYRPGGLFRKQITIDKLHIAGFMARLEQDRDSVWNFLKLINPSEDTDTTQSEFTWKITVNDLRIDRAKAAVNPIDTASIIPGNLAAGLRMHLSYSQDTINATVSSFSVATSNPEFAVESFTGAFEKNGSLVVWKNAVIDLPNSLLVTDGFYDTGESGKADIKIVLEPVDFSDIRVFIPDLGFYGAPDISVVAKGDKSRYDFDIEIIEQAQRIDLSGWLSDYTGLPRYHADLSADNLDFSQWTNNPEFRTNISARMEVNGKGFDIRDNDLDVSGSIGGISYGEYRADEIVLNATKRNSTVSGTLNASTLIAGLDLEYDVKDLFGEPVYDLILEYADLNINDIPGMDSLETSLNGALRVTGTGTSKETLTAGIALRSDFSEILGQGVEEFEINARFDKGDYTIDIPGMGRPYFIFSADGGGNIDSGHNVDFEFEPIEPDTLLRLFGLPDAEFTGRIAGNVTGTAETLRIRANAELTDIVLDSISVAELNTDIGITLSGKKYEGDVSLNSTGIGFGAITMKSADIEGRFSENNVFADLAVNYDDSLRASFTGAVEGFENPVIRVQHLGINYNEAEWNTGHDSAYIVLNKESIEVNSFNLNSGEQNINLHGQFAFNGNEDISATISNLDLQALPLHLFLPYRLEGFVNLDIAVGGTAGEPVIEGYFNADELEVMGVRIDSIRSDLNYSNKLLSYGGTIDPDTYEPVEVSLELPVNISLSDSIFMLKDEPGFNASVKFDSLDLEKVFALVSIGNTSVSGFGSADIKAGNTVAQPDITGLVKITGASVGNTTYGADYKNVLFTGRIDSSRVTIEELSASTRKGSLGIAGFLEVGNTDSLEMNRISMILKATDFQALKSNAIELNFDAGITLEGLLGNPVFGGTLGINSSKLNVDYLGEMLSQRTDDPDPPLLIEALRDTLQVQADTDTTSGPSFPGNIFFKNLGGELVTDIPGNMWITGKDMNFELEGTLRAVKSFEVLSLFGDLNVKRGYYKLYGRTFDFEKGEIHFTGGSDFNPDVDFEIVYRFRDIEKELRELTLLVKGKVLQPSLAFQLDEEPLEEKDAISYLVFGKSVNELGDGERSKLSGENIAMGAALTQLSGALRGVLQESAGIDVFEVSGGEDWRSGSVTIGKYITNNLFLSYDRSFDFNKQTRTADTEKIMLEYQFFRNLVLKATNQDVNSGFDLIFKKNWK